MIRHPPRPPLFPSPPPSRPPAAATIVYRRAAASAHRAVAYVDLRKWPNPRAWLVEKLGALADRSEEHTSELQSQSNLVCRLLLEKKKHKTDDQACRCRSPHT